MTHPVPAAIDYLFGKLTVELEGVQILDGPPIVELSNKGVAIGWAPDRLSAEINKPTEGLMSGGLGGGDGISFDINCLVWVRSGDSEMKPIRDEMYATLGRVDTFVQQNRRLGGVVTKAHLRLADYDELQTPEDSWATAAFVITCNAFTS